MSFPVFWVYSLRAALKRSWNRGYDTFGLELEEDIVELRARETVEGTLVGEKCRAKGAGGFERIASSIDRPRTVRALRHGTLRRITSLALCSTCS